MKMKMKGGMTGTSEVGGDPYIDGYKCVELSPSETPPPDIQIGVSYKA